MAVLTNLREDVKRLDGGPGWKSILLALLLDSGFQALFLYRAGRYCRKRGVPVVGPTLSRLAQILTGAEIAPKADIGPGFKLSHGAALVIGGSVKIGAEGWVHQGVTLGGARPDARDQMPTIGDRVFIGAGAVVLGGITIGDDVVIGANAVVVHDVPDQATVLGPVAEIRVRR